MTRASETSELDERWPFSPVTNFIVLYALLYAAFGAASPFMPALIEERGIASELIGVVFGAGTAIRLVSAPIAGRIADATHALSAGARRVRYRHGVGGTGLPGSGRLLGVADR